MSSLGMLVYKEVQQQRQRLIFGCVLMLVFGLRIDVISQVSAVLTGLLTVTGMGSAFDDDQGGLLYLRSLPLPARNVVMGKFIAMVVFATVYLVAGLLPTVILSISRDHLGTLVANMLISAGAGLLLVGVMYIIYFRYGYRYIQLSFMYMMAGLVVLSFIVDFTVKQRPSGSAPMRLNFLIEGLNVWVTTSVWQALLTMLVGTMLMYAALGWFAVRSLSRREL